MPVTEEQIPVTKDGMILLSISRGAREFGVARQTAASRLLAAGVQAAGVINGHKAYEMRSFAYAVLLPDFVQAKAGDYDDEHFEPEKLPPKDRKDFYDSEKKRLEVEEAKKLLMPAAEFHAEISAVCKTIAQFFDVLPDILERDCGLDPATIDRIQAVVDDQRTALADRVESIEP